MAYDKVSGLGDEVLQRTLSESGFHLYMRKFGQVRGLIHGIFRASHTLASSKWVCTVPSIHLP
jgi:hypothetical protein